MKLRCKVFGHKSEKHAPSEVVDQKWDEEGGVVVLSMFVYVKIHCERCGEQMLFPDIPTDVMEA